MQALKDKLQKAHNELLADGWQEVCTSMASGSGLSYGVLFIKDGKRFYLNKDTLCGSYGPDMAKACFPLFN